MLFLHFFFFFTSCLLTLVRKYLTRLFSMANLGRFPFFSFTNSNIYIYDPPYYVRGFESPTFPRYSHSKEEVPITFYLKPLDWNLPESNNRHLFKSMCLGYDDKLRPTVVSLVGRLCGAWSRLLVAGVPGFTVARGGNTCFGPRCGQVVGPRTEVEALWRCINRF